MGTSAALRRDLPEDDILFRNLRGVATTLVISRLQFSKVFLCRAVARFQLQCCREMPHGLLVISLLLQDQAERRVGMMLLRVEL